MDASMKKFCERMSFLLPPDEFPAQIQAAEISPLMDHLEYDEYQVLESNMDIDLA